MKHVLAVLIFGGLSAHAATFAVKVLDCAGLPVTKELEISLTKVDIAGHGMDTPVTQKGTGETIFKSLKKGYYRVSVKCDYEYCTKEVVGSVIHVTSEGGGYGDTVTCCCKSKQRACGGTLGSGGADGEWVASAAALTTASGIVKLSLQNGQLRLEQRESGRLLIGIGAYTQAETGNPQNVDSVAGVFQFQGLPGLHYLLAHVRGCALEPGRLALSGRSSSLVNRQEVLGGFALQAGQEAASLTVAASLPQ